MGTTSFFVRLKIQKELQQKKGEMNMKKWKKIAAVLAAAMVLSLGMSSMAYAAAGEINVNGTKTSF